MPPYIMSLSVLPFVIVATCIITNVDVAFFILTTVTSLVKTKTMLVWYVGNIFRVFVLFVVSTEGVRSVAYIVFFVSLVLIRLEKINQCLERFKREPNRFRYHTNIVYMEFSVVQWTLNSSFYVALTSLFWLVVCNTWITVRNSQMPYILYASLFAVNGTILCFLLAMLPTAARQIDKYKWVVGQNIQNARQLNVGWVTKASRFALGQAVSIRCIEIKCGYTGKIGKEFSNEYFSDIILRCFEVILLF